MKKPNQNTLKNLKDQKGNRLTEEDKVMDIWKRCFQILLKEEEIEKETEITKPNKEI